MFSKYKPTWMIDAIYKITPAQLKKLGIKAVLTDLDNTLIGWNRRIKNLVIRNEKCRNYCPRCFKQQRQPD